MKTDVFKSELEQSFLTNDLSKDLKQRIELFLANTNLSSTQKTELVKILEEVFDEGYVTEMYIDQE